MNCMLIGVSEPTSGAIGGMEMSRRGVVHVVSYWQVGGHPLTSLSSL